MVSLYFSPRQRRRIHAFGGWLMVLGIALVLVVTIHPCRIELGPILIRMHSVRNPVMLLLFGYAAWCATVDRYALWLTVPLRHVRDFVLRPREHLRLVADALVGFWRRWGWRGVTMLMIALCQLTAVALYWQGYPAYLNRQQSTMDDLYRSPSYTVDGHTTPLLEGFSRSVAQQLPPDARILYRGHTAGLRFAYEVYPRRVFMLPQEMRTMAATWHVQPLLPTIPVDPALSFWENRLPNEQIALNDFVGEHRITHIVTFDPTDASACRVEPAP